MKEINLLIRKFGRNKLNELTLDAFDKKGSLITFDFPDSDIKFFIDTLKTIGINTKKEWLRLAKYYEKYIKLIPKPKQIQDTMIKSILNKVRDEDLLNLLMVNKKYRNEAGEKYNDRIINGVNIKRQEALDDLLQSPERSDDRDSVQKRSDDQFEGVDDYFGTYDQFPEVPQYYIQKVNYNKEAKTIEANLVCPHKEKIERIRQLREYFFDILKNCTVGDKMRYFFYFVGLGWRSYYLRNSEDINKFLNTISDETLGAYNLDQALSASASEFYVKGEIPKIEFVDLVRIEPLPDLIVNTTNGGSFFPYKLNAEYIEFEQILADAQIFTSLTVNDKVRKEFDDNCLVYALKQAGLPKDTIDNIKRHCWQRYTSYKDVRKICEMNNILMRVIKYDYHKKQYINVDTKTNKKLGDPNTALHNVELAIFNNKEMKHNNHYVFNKELEIETFYLNHYEEIKNYCKEKKRLDYSSFWNKQRYNKKCNKYQVKDKKSSHKVKMIELINWLFERNAFTPYKLEEMLNLDSDLYKHTIGIVENLEYPECDCRKITATNYIRVPIDIVYYADIEASTQGEHEPYCISYSSRNEKEIHNFYGFDCIDKFLDKIPNKALVYFHNLGYDGRFFAKYGIVKAINKGSKIMDMNIKYKGKFIKFRDSYSMIANKLEMFPAMFKIDGVKKEMYPYNYYTHERVKNNIGIIDEAGNWELKTWTLDSYNEFRNNIDSINGCRLSETLGSEYFDMNLYCKFYCNQDVRILKEGHMKFRQMALDNLHMDIDNYISAPSLAHNYLLNNVYSKIPNLYEYSGVVREFIQGAVTGGRCMTRDNKKYHIKKVLSDFDACSLYPSAMNRLLISTGKPIVVPELQLNNYLLEHLMDEQQQEPTKDKFISSFVVDIEITKIGKELHFPLIVKKDKSGNHNVNECCNMRVSHIVLKDLIKYQQIEYKILRGYMWQGPRSDLLEKEIKKLYELRSFYKKEGNPMQEVIKLIMNSAYGKTIQKPITTDIVYKRLNVYKFNKETKTMEIVKEYDKYIVKNYQKINCSYSVSNNIAAIEVNKSIDDFFVPNLIGVEILAMSKRIMNEVMVTCEDLNIPIYYQDTDSMHIEKDRIEELATEFKRIYGRELIGSDMGQFHNDFVKINGRESFSIESYFLGKKAYIDKLTNKKGQDIKYHQRLKGIPEASLNLCANNEFDNDPLKLYESLYKNKTMAFDLVKVKPCFEMGKDMTIKTKNKFIRNISFVGVGIEV